MEAALYERIPLGSTLDEVESFIAKNLQPSESCQNIENLCVRVNITIFTCVRASWMIAFAFEDGLLSELNAYLQRDGCID